MHNQPVNAPWIAKGAPSPAEQSADKPVLELRTEDGGMAAFLSVKSITPEQELTVPDILDFLRQNKIIYGIRREAIEEYCANRRFSEGFLCAKGLSPVDGEDGQMEFLFSVVKSAAPQQREDGTVNYRDLGLIRNVRKGEPLCRITPPKPGTDGVDVFGRTVRCKEGQVARFPTGRNTAASEDGLTLVAVIDGCIEYKSMVLDVLDSYIVRGNVDGSSGNVDTVGSVTVLGDVLEGFSVRAGGSITVRGMVEGANLQAGGNIVISKGMNGMCKGRLVCGGDVTAKFLENCTIECGGDLCSDVLMNCAAKAGGSVILRGKNGLLLGGRCTAGRRIYANYIGNANNVRTEAIIDSPALEKLLRRKRLQAEAESNRKEIEKLRTAGGLLKNQQDTLEGLLTIGHTHDKVEKLLEDNRRKQQMIDKQVSLLQEKIAESEATAPGSPVDFSVIGVRILYGGTRITVGTCSVSLKQDCSSAKFYLGKDELESGPLLPSDRMEY